MKASISYPPPCASIGNFDLSCQLMRCKTGGTRLSRPPTERGTQGTSHSAPRAEGVRWGTVATSATLPRAGAVRWGTVATSATLPRDHPGGDNGRDALVASAYGTWNNVEHRGHPIQRHAQRAFDGARSRQARPSRAPMPFDGARSRQARPSRATIPEETTGGTRLSRPPTERRTQGASHSAPRAEGGAGTSRAGAVRWGTVATSATLPRDHPGEDDGRDALVASAYGTWRPPAQPAWGTSRDPPRAKNKARREHASGRTGLAEGGGFEPPIR